ncbi:MAG: TetR/AcrR family transcriptional regulator C-terminal domain-containing protein [Spirochaetales bacterium]|nr:TetR/AcrR family transcriptional regulator C-terminal domain-containing protein [Spirochaetales bacterium]
MANFTRQAIIDSFRKLLNEKPVNKITVRNIVKDCGVNRNTLYYHFRDIPALVEEIFLDEGMRTIERYSDIESLEDCICAIIDYIQSNRRAVLNLFRSSSKDIYETFLWKSCDTLVRSYMDRALNGLNLSKSDSEIIIRSLKCNLFGQIMDWINSGMKDDAKAEFHRYCQIWPGVAECIMTMAFKEKN